MPLADPSFGWTSALLALGLIALVAFLVSWVVTDRLEVQRPAYVAILAAVAVGLAAGYVAWSGTSWHDLVVDGWLAGLSIGVAAAVLVTPAVRKMPRHPHAHDAGFAGKLGWEAVVYGLAEALLLAMLPVLAAWQAFADLGWTDGAWSKIVAGALAVLASVAVTLVHHLGYAQFRRRDARTMLRGALVVCGSQGLAFLLAGNVLAPIVAHVLLHTELLLRGVELPPVSAGSRRTVGVAA
jgi:hypothetical protein